MMTKELTYRCSRVLPLSQGQAPQAIDGRVTLSFYMRASDGDKNTLMTRYTQAISRLDRECRAIFDNNLVLGLSQPSPALATRWIRLATEADSATVGNDLVRRIVPNMLKNLGFKVERLNITFGVFEKATCFPRRDAIFEYVYQRKLTQEQRDEDA